MSERLSGAQPTRIEHDVFRKIWFDTGGGDVWGDATDEDIDVSEAARFERQILHEMWDDAVGRAAWNDPTEEELATFEEYWGVRLQDGRLQE